MMQRRITWIDNCKAIAISLVVLGHLETIYLVNEVIFAFVLPVFFFLSGYTFGSSASMSFGKMFLKKVRTLLVPYFGFSAILFAFWFFVRRNFGLSGHAADTPVSDALVQILYGVNSEVFVTPLWFLTCLFVVEIAFWCLLHLRKKFLITSIVTGLFAYGIFYWTYMDIRHFPHAVWNVDQACFYLFFFSVGFAACKHNLVERIFCSKRRSCLACAIASVFFALAFWLRDHASVTWEYLLMQTLMCNAGLIGFVSLCKMVPGNSFLNFLGQNTLTIFALHMMVQAILIGATVSLFHMDVGHLHGSLWICVLLTLVSLVILIPEILFINRFIPWLAGRQKSS